MRRLGRAFGRATRLFFYCWLPFLALVWTLEVLVLQGLLERFMGETLHLLP